MDAPFRGIALRGTIGLIRVKEGTMPNAVHVVGLDIAKSVFQVHCANEPKGKPMPVATARANAAKSAVRARIEHVFAHQKNKFGLFIRTIGIARAEAKLTLANMAYNFDRLIFHEKRLATP